MTVLPAVPPEWVRGIAGGVSLQLHIQPGARRSEVAGAHGDALKLRLAAPPVDGRANEALLDFLARALGVSRRSVRLVSGETSRRKRVEVADIGVDSVLDRLLPAPLTMASIRRD